jgi:predicted ATPase with chaperone activity
MRDLFKLSETQFSELAARVKVETARRTRAATAATDPGVEIKGQEMGKRALLVALAGPHSILFLGSKDSGKTVLRALAASFGHLDTFEHRLCPCGNFAAPSRACKCTTRQIEATIRKRPIAEITIEIPPPSIRELESECKGTSREDLQKQLDRQGPRPERFDRFAESLIKHALAELQLTPRDADAFRNVAQTIASLARLLPLASAPTTPFRRFPQLLN